MSITRINRQWLLGRRPQARVVPEDFAYREEPFDEPPLAPGQILARSRLFRFAPAMRTWMKGTSQFAAPMALGRPVMGTCAAEVIDSANADYPVGRIVSVMMGWQDYAVIDPARLLIPLRVKPDDVSIVDFEGIYGSNSLAAYFGLLRVGQPAPNETLLVSGAAGSTGAIAAQIGKIQGCRVIGIAGGPAKCDWLLNDCRLDAAIDYKSQDVAARLADLCPRGINVFFDNVGGALLDAAIEHMAPHGRVVLCGQISSYDDGDALAPGPRNMMRVIYWRLKLQGFLSIDHYGDLDVAQQDLQRWAGEGRLAHHEEIEEGFARLPLAFMRLFDGSHFGTLLLKVD